MSTLLGKFIKQPSEILDYDVDFGQWFAGRSDSPVSHETTVETGITLVSSILSGEVVRVVLAGGANGQTYKVTVRMTTSNGLVKEADFAVRIREV